ncbi:MAG TPA: hypothetical protein G4N91_04860 [Dehalococcoidia bacterium]|nr:hypothetical protein [Dehalococcoidia bacterium]
MKDKEFNNILDECLERLLVGGETLEQCLRRYPQQAAELKPLLETALMVKEASAIQPRAEFKARARYQLGSALRESPRGRRLFGWMPQWATVVVMALVLMLAGGGLVAAAAGSMPDSVLYPVKLATEEVQLALVPSQMDRARLCADFADRRVAEIIYMAEQGDAEQVQLLTQRLAGSLDMLAVLATDLEGAEPQVLSAPAPDWQIEEGGRNAYDWADNQTDSENQFWTTVVDAAAVHPDELRAALAGAPEEVRTALLEAIAVSEAGYQNILHALD